MVRQRLHIIICIAAVAAISSCKKETPAPAPSPLAAAPTSRGAPSFGDIAGATGLTLEEVEKFGQYFKDFGLTVDQVKRNKNITSAHDKADAAMRVALAPIVQAEENEASQGGDLAKFRGLLREEGKLRRRILEIDKQCEDARQAILTQGQKDMLEKVKDADLAEWSTPYHTADIKGDMARVCDLNAEQSKAIIALAVASDLAIRRLAEKNVYQIQSKTLDFDDAWLEDDGEKVDRAEEELRRVSASRDALEEKYEADQLATLTDVQRSKWIVHVLFEQLPRADDLQKRNLSDEQIAKLKEVCATWGAQKGATTASASKKLENMEIEIATLEQKKQRLKEATIAKALGRSCALFLREPQKSVVSAAYEKLPAEGMPSFASIKDRAGMQAAAADIAKKLKPQVDAMVRDQQESIQRVKAPEATTQTRPSRN
jgi:hypothetical protein